MICSRCGHPDIPDQTIVCPNCGFQLQKKSRSLTTTTSFRALSARRKMLTERHYALPFSLGDEVFGQFKIRDLLGQGPLGVVYQVTNERGDLYALKVIHKRWRSDMDFDTLQGAYLTMDELEDRARLNLPVEVLIQDQNAGLLSPHIEGLTVRKVMSLRKNTAKAFKLQELKLLVHGIGNALMKLHSVEVPHGGIKPENFFVSTNDRGEQQVTLSDTCLATGVGLEAYHRAQRAAGLGHYMAPELNQGELYITSDIFSLSAFIFEGLTGHAYQSKKSIRELIPVQGIDPLEAFLAKALHADPSERHQSVSDMLADFDEMSARLAALDGSPFNSEQTEPRNEHVGLASGEQRSFEHADPLLGDYKPELTMPATPPPLPAHSSIVNMITPPPLPIPPSDLGMPRPLLQQRTTPASLEEIKQLSQTSVQDVAEPSLDIVPIPDPQSQGPRALRKVDSADLLSPQLSMGVPQMRPRRTVVSQKQSKPKNPFFWVTSVSVVLLAALGVYQLLNHDREHHQGVRGGQGVEVSLSPRAVTETPLVNSGLPTSQQPQAPSLVKPSAQPISATPGVSASAATQIERLGETKSQASSSGVQASQSAASKKAVNVQDSVNSLSQKSAGVKDKKPSITQPETRPDQSLGLSRAAEQKATDEQRATQQKAVAKKQAADRGAPPEKKAAAKKRAAEQKNAAQHKAAERRAAARKVSDKRAVNKREAERRAVAAEKRDADRKAAAEKRAAERRAAAAKRLQDKREAEAKERERKRLAAEQEAREKKENAPQNRVPPKAQVAVSATSLKCPAGMILKTTARFPRRSIRRGTIKGKKAIALAVSGKAYCIDAYEYPGRNRRPKTNVTFKGAQSLCNQANKRLCTPSEWRRACVGRRGSKYPYGKRFNPKKCVTEDAEGEERRLVKSGSMKQCKSASGAYDMSGNAAEWTEGQRVYGGYFASDEDDSSCNAGGRRNASSKRGYIGFRCCADFTSVK